MKTYRNKNWTKRNYECTNIVFQVTDGQPRAYSTGEVDLENWVAVDESVAGFDKIGGFGSNDFYGYL